MPKPKREYPENIRPYIFHGLDLSKDGKNWIGDCPFCQREGKLAILEETGQGRCFVCGVSEDKDGDGFNVYGFLRLIHQMSLEAHDYGDSVEFCKEKGFSNYEYFSHWGLCKSVVGREDWLMPGHSANGQLTQLYRLRALKSGKQVMLCTAGIKLKMLGVNLYNHSKGVVYLCEGYKDSIRLYELLNGYRISDGECVKTANRDVALIADANVLGVPGLGFVTQLGNYSKLFSGKTVVLCFDSDHPREANGKVVEPAGYSGVKRATKILSELRRPPESIQYLKWSDAGYDENQPSGFDLSDLLAV